MPCPAPRTTTSFSAKTPIRALSCLRHSFRSTSFERVQLYTYDLIHEHLGFKMFWGGLIVYGWLYILPLWGMAAYPDPGFSPGWTKVWLIGTPRAVSGWLGHLARRQYAEIHVQAMARAQVSGAHRA